MQPFFLQVRQMLVDGGERREAEPAADLFEARRVAVLLDELLEIVEDLALSLRQWLHAHAPGRERKTKLVRTIHKEKAKIQRRRQYGDQKHHGTRATIAVQR